MKRSFLTVLFICLSISAGLLCAGACMGACFPVPGVMPPTTPGAGGSAGGGGQEVQCDTAFDRTGTLRSDGIFTSMLINNFVIVGDEGNTNLAQRGIVSVVLNQIPAGANVESVILQIMGSAPEGNPFDDFGFMTVDHIDVVSNIGATAFLGKTLTANIATIDTLPGGLMQQTVALDVTAQVQADLAAGRPISSFRFQFANAPSLDGVFDQVFCAANQNDASARPIAIATFTP